MSKGKSKVLSLITQPGTKTLNAKKVSKHNDLINASYSLDTVEQRLILLAIHEARKNDRTTPIDGNTIIDIPASSYADLFGTTNQAAYMALREAGLSLKRREFTFVSNRHGVVHGSWLQHVEYIDRTATLSLAFTVSIIPYISKLEENFTSYELNQISSLSSKYAIRLYELLIQWQNRGCETPIFQLQELRDKLGVLPGEYPRINNFKSRVLDVAVTQINAHSNIKIMDIVQFKNGRTVDGFKFKYQKKIKDVEKAKKDDGFIKMTRDQLVAFSNQMAHMSELSHMAQGNEPYEQFAARIAKMLADKEKQKILLPYLKLTGFKDRYKKS